METQIYTEELVNKMRDELINLNETRPLEFYWDYRDELSKEQIETIIESEDGIFDVSNELWDLNMDSIFDMEMERLKEVFESVNEDEDLEFEEIEMELRDELLDYLSVDTNIEDLIKNTGQINVRVEMLSNYDCINSHYFEGGYEYQESYFGDMIDALNLNPQKVKRMLVDKGVEVYGAWRNKPHRNDKEYVSYEDFWQEMENSCCGANLLTFMATIDLQDYLNNKDSINKVTVPKGNYCGIYSSMQGGGSVIEMELKRDFTVELKTKDYFGYRMVLDESSGYSIHEVYGMSQSAWKNNIKF